MSYTRVFIHYVWATRRRKHTLLQPHRQLLFDHIKQNALLKGIILDRVNGYTNHVHCLVWLKPQQTMDQVAQLLKGESSYWYNNKSGISGNKLQWQKDYFAASVSLSMMERLRNYIDNQETHHQKKTFEEEYEEMLKTFLITKDLENSADHYILNTGR
jgi:putative transposase